MPSARTPHHNSTMTALPQPNASARIGPGAHLPLWQRLLRHLAGGLVVSVSVAVLISLIFGDGLWNNLVISLCIGGCIQALIEAGRYGISAWLRQRGDRRAQVLNNWPGWPLMAPCVLLSALLGYWLGRNLAAMLLGQPWPVQMQMQGGLRTLVLVLGITVAASVVATYHFFMRSQVATVTAQAEAAQRLAADNQLRLLQSQLEPHMLFNTLANLRVLVTLDPPRAQAMLDHLIRYLRATLGASHANLHPLATEFALLGDYLALMALRMGPRLQVQLQLPEALRQHPVPPLLLQPLVENCIRHGLEPQVAGGRIDVRAELQGGQLLLTVRDTGVGLPAVGGLGPAADSDRGSEQGSDQGSDQPDQPGSHYGTRHVAERLATLYGTQASFRLRPAPDADGGTLAELRLPLADALATRPVAA